MRIAWATPFNVRSRIAKYSYDIAMELLRRGLHIAILRTETAGARQYKALRCELPIRWADRFDATALRDQFDLCVVNIGDCLQFHRHAIDLMLRRPSVGIFHGVSLDNLMGGLRGMGYPIDQGIEGMESRGMESPTPEINLRPICLLASLALGAVGHGPHYMHALTAWCPGPVLELPLYSDRDTAAQPWGGKAYSPSAYVDALLPLLRAALECSPHAEAGRIIGETLASMGIEWGDPMTLRLAKITGDLFGR